MASIKFEYLYRDEGNYKEYGEVIFSNPNEIPQHVIQRIIEENLIEGSWFDPDEWMIPRFSFHQVNLFGINDSLWYEFVEVEEVEDSLQLDSNINELIKGLSATSKNKSYIVWRSMQVLLKGAKETNIIYKVAGIKCDYGFVNEINSRSNIKDRISRIVEKGASLAFTAMEGDIFNNNLVLIDSLLPQIIGEMLFYSYLKGEMVMNKLVSILEELNPLGFNQEHKHPLYSYKIKRILTELALGMSPKKIWNGQNDRTGGFLMAKESGDILYYDVFNMKDFENYLLNHTRLETDSSLRHGFGEIYEEGGEMFMKLSMQIWIIN
jgi:hypothetical protein